MKKILKLSTLLLSLTLGIEASALSTFSKVEPSSVINMVEKERTLIQEMNQELLYTLKGINPKENLISLKNREIVFEKVLKGLINGDRDLALLECDNKETLAKLNAVMKEWVSFKDDIAKFDIESIAKNNISLLKKVNDVIKDYADISKDKDVMKRAEFFEQELSSLSFSSMMKNSISQLEEVSKMDMFKL